jgi:hypothetical protein
LPHVAAIYFNLGGAKQALHPRWGMTTVEAGSRDCIADSIYRPIGAGRARTAKLDSEKREPQDKKDELDARASRRLNAPGKQELETREAAVSAAAGCCGAASCRRNGTGCRGTDIRQHGRQRAPQRRSRGWTRWDDMVMILASIPAEQSGVVIMEQMDSKLVSKILLQNVAIKPKGQEGGNYCGNSVGAAEAKRQHRCRARAGSENGNGGKEQCRQF